MGNYIKSVEVRWSDLDPNFHLRHSVYYDYGAYCRIAFLDAHGLTAAFMAQNNLGPVLFREECVFRKEIRLGDVVKFRYAGRYHHGRWCVDQYAAAQISCPT